MAKKSQIIFMDGKERALQALFDGEDSVFGYLAIGFAEIDNGFEDITEEQTDNGFHELQFTNNYERIPLNATSDPIEKDPETGKVLAKFAATLDEGNITVAQKINQIAVVDSKTVGDADTKYYSATTFPTFTKNQDSSITFVIGFRL